MSAVYACAFVICATAASIASVPLSEGMAPFGFGIESVRRPSERGTFDLRVIASGEYDSSAVGETHVVLPAGIECVSGKTVFRGRMTADPRNIRTLVLRVRHQGSYTVRALLSVTGAHGARDEAEAVALVELATDTLVLGAYRTVRLECVRGGQRYRYGGSFLVPIPAPERITEDDIRAHGSPARVIRQVVAKCPSCSSPLPATMGWVVFVAADGHLMDARPNDASIHDAAAIQASRAALASWSFGAARVYGMAVNDYLAVRVPMVR